MSANRTDGQAVDLDRDTLDRLLDQLGADALTHLAAVARRRELGPRPKFVDPERAAAELVAMAEAGATPTIGWWRRNLMRVSRLPPWTFDPRYPGRSGPRLGSLRGNPRAGTGGGES